MLHPKWIRLGAAACACAALTGAVRAGTARAGLPAPPALLHAARARILPAPAPAPRPATGAVLATEQLSTFTRPVRARGSTYWIGLDVLTDGSGGTPQLEVYLVRGRRGSYQLHEYWWLRTASFSVDRRAMTARLRGGAISPSAIALRFRPTREQSHTCTLSGGGTGTYRTAVGRLSVSRFRIATNTSPVFGTITIRPRRAELVLDPGCRPGAGRGNARPCPPAETIDAPGPAPSEWVAATSRDGTRVLLGAISASQTPTKLQHSHLTEETVPRADLPPPELGAHGATATFLTAGSVFTRGTGVFTSSRAPTVTTGSCTLQGVVHTYQTTSYRGVLASGVPPLLALFDTGHIGLTSATPAGLSVSRLTS